MVARWKPRSCIARSADDVINSAVMSVGSATPHKVSRRHGLTLNDIIYVSMENAHGWKQSL
jgi:hypothetical protein